MNVVYRYIFEQTKVLQRRVKKSLFCQYSPWYTPMSHSKWKVIGEWLLYIELQIFVYLIPNVLVSPIQQSLLFFFFTLHTQFMKIGVPGHSPEFFSLQSSLLKSIRLKIPNTQLLKKIIPEQLFIAGGSHFTFYCLCSELSYLQVVQLCWSTSFRLKIDNKEASITKSKSD